MLASPRVETNPMITLIFNYFLLFYIFWMFLVLAFIWIYFAMFVSFINTTKQFSTMFKSTWPKNQSVCVSSTWSIFYFVCCYQRDPSVVSLSVTPQRRFWTLWTAARTLCLSTTAFTSSPRWWTTSSWLVEAFYLCSLPPPLPLWVSVRV